MSLVFCHLLMENVGFETKSATTHYVLLKTKQNTTLGSYLRTLTASQEKSHSLKDAMDPVLLLYMQKCVQN